MRFSAITASASAALLTAAICASAAVASPSFVRLPAEMAQERDVPVAAPLPDGKVLIAGGVNVFSETTGSAELFDPQTGTFESLSTEMRGRREEAASAVLSNGAVLIVGGFAEGALWLKSAERFDPATNSFEELPPMTTERDQPAVATLGNGDVLIAGGNNHNMTLANAELFEPESATFAPLAAGLAVAGGRSGAFGIALPDGQALVAGGNNKETLLQSAELFGPPVGPFELLSSAMSEARTEAAHALLQNGDVLVAGGRDATPALKSAELFDPATTSFTRIAGELTTERDGAAAAPLPNGEVLIVGGRNSTGNLKSAELAIPAAPAAITSSVSGVGTSAATLTGSALSEALGTVYFQYGTSTAYGGSTPRQSLSAALVSHAFAAAAGGLAPGTTYHYREVAENVGGAGYGSDQTFTTASLPTTFSPPVISGVRQSASRWREGSKLPRISRRKLPLGTTFTFSLNEPSSVTFAFTRRTAGHRVGHSCEAGRPRHGKHRACSRTVTVGVLAFSGPSGANKVAFDGRISRSQKLKPGRYMLVIRASDAAGRSGPVSLSFTIARG